MTTSYDTDPNTQTIAAAWASSQLGQPEREVRYSFATTGPAGSVTTSEEEPTARRVMVAAGLACGVAAGALLGVMLFAGTSQPTVVAPGPAPQHAVVVGSSTAAPAPKPVVSEQSTAPTAVTPAPAPRLSPSPTDFATPPPASHGDTTVVVDVPIPAYPPLPEKPGQQDPEPPKPEDPDPEPPKPPVLDTPNFKLPEPPKPEPPKPEPPTFLPDLPLAPKPPKAPVVIDPVFGP
jgi:hypothetical protein